jgi:hypothetical protein
VRLRAIGAIIERHRQVRPLRIGGALREVNQIIVQGRRPWHVGSGIGHLLEVFGYHRSPSWITIADSCWNE